MPDLSPLHVPIAPHTETMCVLPGGSSFGNGSTLCGPHYSDPHQLFLLLVISTAAALYNPKTDGWVFTVNPAFSGTLAIAAVAWNPNGPTGTVSAATPDSITTNYTGTRDLGQYTIRITGGTGKGQERVVSYNTIGASSAFTVTQPWDVQPDATSTWVLRTGRFYVFTSTGTVIGFKYFDVASMAWTTLSTTGVPSTWTTSVAMCAPHCSVFVTGTATFGGASTLTNAAKSWLVNQWSNQQVRITGGTGAGQTRTISSNTSDTLTVSSAWSEQPDNTSVYEIGANEDYIYLIGNSAATLYRYSISAGTWVTISPVAARGSGTNGGNCLISIDQETDAFWTDETNYLNGRYLYAFRGGSTDHLAYYDVAFNTWFNDVSTGGANPISYVGRTAFGQGSSMTYHDGVVYMHAGNSGFTYKFYPARNYMEPWARVTLAQSGTFDGNKLAVARYVSGNKIVKFIYLGMCGLTNVVRLQDF